MKAMPLVVVTCLLALLVVHQPACAAVPGDQQAQLDSRLYKAIETNHVSKVRSLIKEGANVNAAHPHWGTTMQLAATYGLGPIVRLLLKSGVDVDKGGLENGWTPLLSAAQFGHVDVVEQLLEAGANPLAKLHDTGDTALLMAIIGVVPVPGDARSSSGRAKIVRLLIDAGADLEASGQSMNTEGSLTSGTALVWALNNAVVQAMDGPEHAQLVKTLIDYGADVDAVATQSTGETMTALSLAAQLGKARYIKLLLAACADPDIDDGHGATPLFMAAQGGHVASVAALIEGCADIRLARHEPTDWFMFGSSGMTPQMKAQEKVMFGQLHLKRNYAEIVQLLQTAEGDIETSRTCTCTRAENPRATGDADTRTSDTSDSVVEAFMLAVQASKEIYPVETDRDEKLQRKREYEIDLERMLEDGFDIDTADEMGFTALIHCAMQGQVPAAELLIGLGADVNVQWAHGPGTPLTIAAADGHVGMVQLLLQSGAEPDMPALSHGMTPLYKAAFHATNDKPALTDRPALNHMMFLDGLGLGKYHDAMVEMRLYGQVDPVKAPSRAKIDKIVGSIPGLDDPRHKQLLVDALLYALPLGMHTANVQVSHLEVVRALLNRTRDPDLPVQHVKQLKLPQTALGVATLNAVAPVCKLLIEAGADPSLPISAVVGSGARSILTLAHNHTEILETMLASLQYYDMNLSEDHSPPFDTRVDTRDDAGQTPLSHAAQNHQLAAVEVLINYGAQVDARDNYRMTPLMLACVSADIDIVRKLLQYGADVKLTAIGGQHALQLAAWHGAHEIVDLLLGETSAISMINQPDLDGTTSLGSALIGEAIDGTIVPAKMIAETVEVLRAYGADTTGHEEAIKGFVSLHADELIQRNFDDTSNNDPEDFVGALWKSVLRMLTSSNATKQEM